MNTAAVETTPTSQAEFYKSEVRRMGLEMERTLAEMAESRLRCERLSAETDENLAAIRVMLDRRSPNVSPRS